MNIKSLLLVAVLVTVIFGFGLSANAQTTATQNSLTQQLIQLLQTLIAQLQAQIQTLLGQQQTQTTSPQIGCTETDGGIDYYQKGTTTWPGSAGSSDIKTDYCVDGNRVAEYYCKWIASEPAPNYYTCPNGCENGACKQATALQPWQIPGGKNVDDCITYGLLSSKLNCYNKHCTKINPALTKSLFVGKTIVNAGASGIWWKFTNESTVMITQGNSVDSPTIQPQYKTWNVENGQVIIHGSNLSINTFKDFSFFDCGNGKIEGVAISSSPNGDLENKIYAE